ncbi:MAG TPA: hypothetical protein ENJ82_01380 [Bacteroidetes bacterium]|nr:hypothetical protein [Bacteroidota bacterium]
MPLPFLPSLRDLPANLGFRVGYSTIADGNMSYTYGPKNEVLANRKAFFDREHLPVNRLIPFITDHQEVITDLESYAFDDGPLSGKLKLTTDVIITQQPNVGILLGFADCVPFVVYDSRQHLLAFAHIGWRSMAQRLTTKLLAHLQKKYGSQPQDLIAVIGPSIKKESYRFRDPIQAQNPAWEPYLHQEAGGRTAIDLFGYCFAETQAAGLHPKQIYAAHTDTAQNPALFSHYAATELKQNHKQGRFYFYAFLKA